MYIYILYINLNSTTTEVVVQSKVQTGGRVDGFLLFPSWKRWMSCKRGEDKKNR